MDPVPARPRARRQPRDPAPARGAAAHRRGRSRAPGPGRSRARRCCAKASTHRSPPPTSSTRRRSRAPALGSPRATSARAGATAARWSGSASTARPAAARAPAAWPSTSSSTCRRRSELRRPRQDCAARPRLVKTALRRVAAASNTALRRAAAAEGEPLTLVYAVCRVRRKTGILDAAMLSSPVARCSACSSRRSRPRPAWPSRFPTTTSTRGTGSCGRVDYGRRGDGGDARPRQRRGERVRRRRVHAPGRVRPLPAGPGDLGGLGRVLASPVFDPNLRDQLKPGPTLRRRHSRRLRTAHRGGARPLPALGGPIRRGRGGPATLRSVQLAAPRAPVTLSYRWPPRLGDRFGPRGDRFHGPSASSPRPGHRYAGPVPARSPSLAGAPAATATLS